MAIPGRPRQPDRALLLSALRPAMGLPRPDPARSAGKELRGRIPSQTYNGGTALALAIIDGNRDAVNVLRRRGATR